jgi:hypothetical protein
VGGDIEEGSASGPGLRGPRSVAEQPVGPALGSLAHGAGPVNQWARVLGFSRMNLLLGFAAAGTYSLFFSFPLCCHLLQTTI